jgi:hypothetical protein
MNLNLKIMMAILIMAIIIPIKSIGQANIVFNHEQKLDWPSASGIVNILHSSDTFLYVYSYSRENPYVYKSRVDTLVFINNENYKIFKKIQVNFKEVPYEIIKNTVTLNGVFLDGANLYISAAPYILIFEKTLRGFDYKRFIIEDKVFINNLWCDANNHLIAVSYLPDSLGNFNIYKFDITKNSLIQKKSFNFNASYLALLDGLYISGNENYSVIANPASYQVFIMKNSTFEIYDTLNLNTNRIKVPNNFQFTYKNKGDFQKLAKLREQYFSIIKVLLVDDSTIVIIKNDDTCGNKSYIDIWLLKKNIGWLNVGHNIEIKNIQSNQDEVFLHENSLYPFISTIPNLAFDKQGHIFLMRNYLDLDNHIGAKYSTILEDYKEYRLLGNIPYNAISKYSIKL